MRRAALGLCAYLAFAGTALAQDKEAAPPGEEAAPPPAGGEEQPAAEPPAADAPKEGQDARTPLDEVKPGQRNWQDIYVVPRRAVLKRKRLEFMPSYNVTLNNPVVRHHGVGASLNLYLSEALFIGIEGTYYGKQITDRYFLLGVDTRVIPSANEYLWSALLDFGYVPIHGKFTFLNSSIIHWETYIAAGVGVFQSKVIPRNPANEPFENFLIAGLLPAIGARMWLSRWFALDAYVKNYIFADTYERTDRPAGQTAAEAKGVGETNLVLNIVFGVGLSIFLPPSFEYKTLR